MDYMMGGALSEHQLKSAVAQQQMDGLAGNSLDKPTPRMPKIKFHIENVDKELSFLREQTAILADRMIPVMSLEPPVENKASDKESEPTCPFAAVLWHLTNQIRQQNQLVNSLIRRLEV